MKANAWLAGWIEVWWVLAGGCLACTQPGPRLLGLQQPHRAQGWATLAEGLGLHGLQESHYALCWGAL